MAPRRTPRFPPLHFRTGTVTFDFSRAYVVGVLNVTPDSFSDGGRHAISGPAIEFGLRCMEDGVDVLDVGGESTRPQAERISADQESARILPVIRALVAAARAPISVDTTKADVAEAALAAGAEIVNDISGGRFDPRMLDVVERSGATYVLGHVRGDSLDEVHAGEGTPPTFAEIASDLAARVAALPAAVRARTIVDPGLGFGKKGDENLELLARAGELAEIVGRPVMVGPSRKRFLGALTGRAVAERDAASVGASLAAAEAGASFLRVHDVRALRDALTVFEAVRSKRPKR